MTTTADTPLLDEIAGLPAARSLYPLSDSEVLVEFLDSRRMYRLERLGNEFVLWDNARDPEPSHRLNPGLGWEWRYSSKAQQLMFKPSGCGLLPSPRLEAALATALELWREQDADPGHPALTDPLVGEIIRRVEDSEHLGGGDPEAMWQQIAVGVEFSRQFSSSTLEALHSGYLPREHLVLAVLMERFPALRDYVASLPLVLTLLAEKCTEGQAWHADFAREIADALRHGWRGLFDLCGLPADRRTLLLVKNVQLRNTLKHSRNGPHEANSITDYLPHLIRLPSLLGGCPPPYDEAWLMNLDAFCLPEEPAGIALSQLNSVFRLEKGPFEIELLVRETTQRSFDDDEEMERYLEHIGTSCLPVITLREHVPGNSMAALSRLAPDRLPVLKPRWLIKRQEVFDQLLSEEERIRFRPLLDCRDAAKLLVIVAERELSPAALEFLQTWENPDLHKAIIRHPNVPFALLEYFYPLYPDDVCHAPVMAFLELYGGAKGIPRQVIGLLRDLRLLRPDCLPTIDDGTHSGNGFFIRMLNIYAQTPIGTAFAGAEDPWIRERSARCLQAPWDCPLWNLLVRDPDWRVRANLALNPWRPPGVTRKLAIDRDARVREILAAQPWFMISPAIEALLRDDSDPVVQALVANLTLPDETQRRIRADSPHLALLRRIKESDATE